ncbi:MAG TPA: HPr family phosphocarrier protein [Chthoniobacterales bacterium]|nr:HPr family phosphocarrier protein [Chthoniobacterales bacterium]
MHCIQTTTSHSDQIHPPKEGGSDRPQNNESMVSSVKELVIKNRNGLHARPSALFVKTAGRFNSEIWVEKEGERVNGKSIMGLMMLAAGHGSVLQVIAEGDDALQALEELEKLIDSRFGEE